MPRYITVNRNGKTYKRPALTKEQQEARIKKFRATMAARKAARVDPVRKSAPVRRGRPSKASGANGHAQDAPTVEEVKRLRRNLDDALIHAKRGEAFLKQAWGHNLHELDDAHVELINTKKALLRP